MVQPLRLFSEKQPDDKKDGEPKVPPGFEKFIKRKNKEGEKEESKETKKEEQSAS